MIFIHDIHAEAQWTSSFIQSHRKLSSWDFCEVSERQNIKRNLIHVNWSCFNTNSKNKRHMLLVWNLTFVIVTVSFLSRRQSRYKKNDTFTYYLNMKTDQKYSCCFKIKRNCWLRRQVTLLSLTWSCERVFRNQHQQNHFQM